MFSLGNRISSIIWWHAGESIVYHGLLLIHQLMLFTLVLPSTYGLIGTTFSILYLAVNVINAGLDATLSALFIPYSTSKQLVWKLINIQLLINSSMSIAALIIIIAWKISPPSPMITCIVLALILLESIKKIIKILLNLTLQFKITTIGELGTVASYVFFVWISYVMGFSINIYLIFAPLLFVVLIETIIFFFYIYQWYQKLPSAYHQVMTANDYKLIVKTRIATLLNQLHHNFFSSNFLVLITAQFFGFDYAGVIKFASSIASNITVIFKKIFGTSNNIVAGIIKNKSIKTQKYFFSLITHKMYHVLFCLSLFFLINYKLLLQATDTSKNIVICLSFLIIFMENFLLTYEQFYLIQEKISYLIFINSSIMFILYGIYLYRALFSPPLLLLSIFLVRLLSLILTSLVSFFLWRLKPIETIWPFYLISSIIISFIIRFIYN